jgi:hypothetical protein
VKGLDELLMTIAPLVGRGSVDSDREEWRVSALDPTVVVRLSDLTSLNEQYRQCKPCVHNYVYHSKLLCYA